MAGGSFPGKFSESQEASVVHRSAIWATAFVLDGPATVATDEDGAVAPMAVAGKDDVGYKQRIADIIERGDAEDDVVDGTNGH